MTTIQKEYGILVDGGFIRSNSGKTIDVMNPATGELLSSVASADSDEADKVIASAEQAFSKWRKTTRTERAALMRQIADRFEAEQEYLAQVDIRETGRCLGEAMLLLSNCISEFRYMAAAIEAYEETLIQHNNDSFSMVVKEPLGVAVLILPWNSPGMLFSWKVAPALAAGNTVIVKPASAAPLVVMELGRICQEVLPPGVLNVIAGSGREVGNYLVGHPKTAKISFTGSTEIGRFIGKVAGENVVPCSLELGGKSANIVFPDAHMDKAIQFAAMAILSSSGQICVSGSRLFLHEQIYDEFLEKLKVKFENVTVGNPVNPETQMGPVVDKSQMNSILDYIDIGKNEGATLLCGGERLTGGEYDRGCFIAPTIFSNVENSMRIAQEEIFGPVLVVIRFSDETEVIKMANDSQYGLAAGVWTKDLQRALRVSRSLEAGLVWVNDFLTSIGPFGGYKKSGLGREIHKVALEYYSNTKNILVSTSDDFPPIF